MVEILSDTVNKMKAWQHCITNAATTVTERSNVTSCFRSNPIIILLLKYWKTTFTPNLIPNSLCEMRLQGIMVLVVTILEWVFVLINNITTILAGGSYSGNLVSLTQAFSMISWLHIENHILVHFWLFYRFLICLLTS